jgi:hypothetical protein
MMIYGVILKKWVNLVIFGDVGVGLIRVLWYADGLPSILLNSTATE